MDVSHWQPERMGAVTAPRLTEGLLDVCGLDSHEVRQLVDDHLALQAVFVHALDAAPLPVRPVDVVSQQREAKDVRQVIVHQHPPARSVHLHHLQNPSDQNTVYKAQLSLSCKAWCWPQ